jgi:hypothetical protein
LAFSGDKEASSLFSILVDVILEERSLLVLLICIPALIMAGILKPVPQDPIEKNKVISQHFWVQKTHGAGKYNLIVLGDSRIYRGISPRAMESILPGIRVLNLGYSNGSMSPLMFREAGRRLDWDNPVRAIILGITPVTLTPVAAENEHFLQEWNRPKDYIFVIYIYRF